MITFSILLAALLLVATIVAIVVTIVGGSVIAVFGDFIVCGLIIWLLVKLFRRKK
jgi:hypothetical protein